MEYKIKEFKECAKCAGEPGSPTLCVACLHNRTVVNYLKREITALRQYLTMIEKVTSLADDYLEKDN